MGVVKWPKRLVTVRHGYSLMNEAHDIANLVGDERQPLDILENMRDMDIPLADEGHPQAVATGKYFAPQEKFDIAFCSPYVRCEQTATHIIDNIGYPLRLLKDNRLRERESGWTYGITLEAIKSRFPGELARRRMDGKYWYRPPGGENWPDVEERVHSFLDKMNRDHAGQNVLVVTHGITFVCFRTLFEHLDEQQVLEVDRTSNVKNCGIAVYELDTSKHPEGRMKLVEYNKTVYDAASGI